VAKLLLVIDSLGSGGAQRQLVTLAKVFKSQGHLVEFFIYYPQYDHFLEDLKLADITVHEYQKRSAYDPKVPFVLSKLIRQNNYDAGLAFLHTPAFYLELAALLNLVVLHPKMTLIFSERSSYFDDEPLSLSFRLAQQFHRLCDHIVSNSQSQTIKMAKTFPWMQKKLGTIYNGIDISLFKRTKVYGANDDEYLLCVSGVVEYKNFERLAKALIHYKHTWGEPPKIMWIGRTSQEPANLKKLSEVKQNIRNAGLENKLIFVGESKNVQEFYENAEGLIHPSLIEGFSNSVIEGMAYGLPLLLGDVSDHDWLISSYQNGLLFDPMDYVSIAESMKQFSDSTREMKHSWSNNSENAIDDNFNQFAAAQKYLDLIKC